MMSRQNEKRNGKFRLTVDTDGIDTTRANKHLPIGFAHRIDEHVDLALGVVKNIEKTEDGIFGELDFDMDSEYSSKVAKKFSKGLFGVSIGITPIEVKQVGKNEVRITKSELYELSVTQVPADQNALKFKYNNKFLDMGNTDEKTAKLFFSEIGDQSTEIVVTDEVSKEIETILESPVELSYKNEIFSLKEKLSSQDDTILQLKFEVEEQKKINFALEMKDSYNKIEELKTLGAINDVQAESYKFIAETNKELFSSLIANTPVVRKNPNEVDVTKLTEIVGERSTWTYSDWYQNDREGLKQMKSIDPLAFNKLYNNKK